jgi:pullulanase
MKASAMIQTGQSFLQIALVAFVSFGLNLPAAQGQTTASPLAVSNAPDLSQVQPLNPESRADVSQLVVHYHRADNDYKAWNVWSWSDNAEGQATDFNQPTAFGQAAIITLPADADQAGFIIRQGNWQQKDIGHDRSVKLEGDRVTEIWLISGDPKIYTDPDQLDFSVKIRAAFLDGRDRIRMSLNHAVDAKQINKGDIELLIDNQPQPITSIKAVGDRSSKYLDLKLENAVEISQLDDTMTLALPGGSAQPVYARDVLNDTFVDATDESFGAFHESHSTLFRTWSPTSSSVELVIYETADASQPMETLPLSRQARGVWEAQVAGDLHGVFYQYRFTYRGESTDVPDIHGYAASADSRRSMVVDLKKTDPEGFTDHATPRVDALTDEIIYEIHVRDFSIADHTVPAELQGKYLGMVQKNADGSAEVSTGLQHLIDLGITAVHLMPIQDFGNERHAYNWGYWTTLFNVPESDYSTSPNQPAQTIRELKQAIHELHRNDIRVILDVVYNHTSITSDPSPFDATVPYFYFRTTDDGEYRNDAGTGNSIADERPMVRKYIVDSLRYWTQQYKVDGFRFDLIGTHQPETVEAIVRELRAVRPDITLYGEPWTGGGPTYFGKGAQRGTTMAVFNDHLRNAIRGDLDGQATGYATGGPQGRVEDVKRGIAGAIDDFADSPIETINYVSAHDNRTFWDKLEYTHPNASDEIKQKMQLLAHAIVLTSQGGAFIHAGADFARTKGGNHNSYNAGDEVNKLDWDRKAEYHDMHRVIRNFIAMRKAHPVFRLQDAASVRKALKFMSPDQLGPSSDHVVAFTLDGSDVNDPWRKTLVMYNPTDREQDINLPAGRWTVALSTASPEPIDTAVSRQFTLPPYSATVAYQR